MVYHRGLAKLISPVVQLPVDLQVPLPSDERQTSPGAAQDTLAKVARTREKRFCFHMFVVSISEALS